MDYDRKRLLVKTARLYYEQHMTQAEISQHLRLSRQKVQRILDEAREEGIVNISIHPIMGIFYDLEKALEKRYGLSEVLVVETTGPDNQDTIAREVGAGGAEYLSRLVRPNDKIVISSGNSLLGMVNALGSRVRNQVRGVTLIQGLGGLLGDPDSGVYGAELVRRAAKALGAQSVLFPAPAIASSAAVRDALYADPYVSQTLALARSADLAFVGIGSADSKQIAAPEMWRFLPPTALQDLFARGSVGSINLRYFDKSGCLVPSELDQRIIGLTLEDLKQINRVVGIAGGSSKYEAIHAALVGRLVNVLVTDHLTAKALMEVSHEPSISIA
jgi:DNA-binding transcriptional regulator LsrR (DeoR family)